MGMIQMDLSFQMIYAEVMLRYLEAFVLNVVREKGVAVAGAVAAGDAVVVGSAEVTTNIKAINHSHRV